LALSRDKAGALALPQKGHEISRPSDLVKDLLVLEFAGLRQDERFRESDLEQALISKLTITRNQATTDLMHLQIQPERPSVGLECVI
jgi:hypothetical protein